MKAVVLRTRELMLDADERIGETIKWSTPTFMYRGNLASFQPRAKQFVSLLFHTGASIPGEHPLLEGGGDVARYVRLADLEPSSASGRPSRRSSAPGATRGTHRAAERHGRRPGPGARAARAEGAAARPPRRRAAARDGDRARRGDRATAELPTTDPDELAKWFTSGADRKSLELYLEGFRHTVAVMQTRDAIERVAAECAEDLAADGVVYAEVRMAPELLTDGGLSPGRRGHRHARRVPARLRGPPDHDRADRDRHAPGREVGRDRRARGAAPRRRASSASTSPARRPATRPRATSTPST